MLKARHLWLLLAGSLAASPASASWDPFHGWSFCTSNSLSVCMDFSLTRNGASDDYQLLIRYTSSAATVGEQGVLTSAGIYRERRDTDIDIRDLSIADISPSDLEWSLGSSQLSGAGPVTIEAAGNSDYGSTHGLPVGGYVLLSFSSTNLATYDLSNLYARSHIQSYGPGECSIKPDSRGGGYVVGSVESLDAECGVADGPSVVPEPATFALLATGLMGFAGLLGRRGRAEADR